MTDISIFRGQVYQNKKFHLYFQDTNNSAGNGSSKVYILCICVNNLNETILYWSCDPSDFTDSTRSSSKNYGPVAMTYEYDPAINTFMMYYENIYGVKTPMYDGKQVNNFSIYANGGNSSANIIYYSHPNGYTITKNGGIEWNFRKDSFGGGVSSINIYRPNIIGSGSVFENMNVKSITLTRVSSSSRKFVFSPTAEEIPNSGIVHFVADDLVYTYNYAGIGTTLVLSENPIFGSSGSSISGNGTIYIRNDTSNFVSLSNPNIEIQFMPVTEHSYFAGGTTNRVSNFDFDFSSDNITRFYNSKGTEIVNIKPNGSLGLYTMVLFINSALGFFNIKKNNKYENITGNLASATDTNVTISIFGNPQDAKQKIFYNYCGNNEYCGNCMGKTLNSNYCTTTNKTLEDFTNNNEFLSSDVNNRKFDPTMLTLGGNQTNSSLFSLGSPKNTKQLYSNMDPKKNGEISRIVIPYSIILGFFFFISIGLISSAYYLNNIFRKKLWDEGEKEELMYSLKTQYHSTGFVTAFMGVINIAFGLIAVVYALRPGSNFNAPNKIGNKDPSKTYYDYIYSLIGLGIIFGVFLISFGILGIYRHKTGSVADKLLVIGLLLLFFGIAYIAISAVIYEESKDLTIDDEQPQVSIAGYIVGSICILMSIYFFYNFANVDKEVEQLKRINEGQDDVAEKLGAKITPSADPAVLDQNHTALEARLAALEQNLNPVQVPLQPPPPSLYTAPVSKPEEPLQPTPKNPLDQIEEKQNLLSARLTALEQKLNPTG